MPEGLYKVDFVGRAGSGLGVIVLMDGKVIGTDGEVDFDGTYSLAGGPGVVHADIQCTVRPGTTLVMGVPPQNHSYAFGPVGRFPGHGERSDQGADAVRHANYRQDHVPTWFGRSQSRVIQRHTLRPRT
ncbi:MAG: hypothetical protein WDN76_05220 [Alphaproteobacteria bacterium]